VVDKRLDANGRISDITYDGWEASSGAGARRIAAATARWRTDSAHTNPDHCPDGRYPPGTPMFRVFSRIHIISLVPESDRLRRQVLIRAGGRCNL
jgi:hypothetical protein